MLIDHGTEAQLAHCGDVLAIAKSVCTLLQRPRATFYIACWFPKGATAWPRIEARVMKARNLRGTIDFTEDRAIVKRPEKTPQHVLTFIPVGEVEYADPLMQEKLFAFVKQVTRTRKKSAQKKKARKDENARKAWLSKKR